MRRFATGRKPLARPDPGEARARASRCTRCALTVSLPAAAVLAAAAAWGAVSPAAAAGLWLAVLASLAAGLWPVAAAVDSAADRARRLADGLDTESPGRAALPGLGRPLDRALERLDREWRGRRARTAGAVAALEAILDALPDPLLLLDEGRAVAFANRAAEEAFGRELVGRPLAAAVRAPALLAAAERASADGVSAKFGIGSESGGPRTFLVRFQTIDGAAADGPRIALTLRDVTVHERGERLRADFVANASHEIRTPLTAIVGAIETLQGPARDDEAVRDRFLAMMRDHAGRILHLVDDLLSLSRIERGESIVPSGTVALRPVVERAAKALAWQAGARRVRIAIDVPETLPPAVGDADELGLVFQNLIDNAVKYGNADSTVQVDAEADAETVAVSVRDQGPGIAAEHIPRLTERFYRVDKARSSGFAGTGLGLAIVKHAVRRHRGALDIASTPGAGSRFTVRLKRAAAEIPAAGDTEL